MPKVVVEVMSAVLEMVLARAELAASDFVRASLMGERIFAEEKFWAWRRRADCQ